MQKHPVVRLLYNNNPLYVVSAALLLWGIRLCYRPEGNIRELWILLGIEGVYLLVLASVCVLVVRWAKVWEDARTILFTIVLLLLSVSCLFDEVKILRPRAGTLLLIGGFTFSCAMSELMIAANRLRLGCLYRIPYYGLLAAFFIYPAIVARLAVLHWTNSVDWVTWSFPVMTGCCLVGVLPAVRKGTRYTSPTGMPWDWPWYPLCFFYFLAILAGFRSWLLCVSFELSAPVLTMDSIFGGYFLVPILLAVLVVQLEVAIVLDSKWMRNTIAVLGTFLPLLAFSVSLNLASQRFLSQMTAVAGPPFLLTSVVTCLFLAYCWIRRVEWADWLLILSLAVMASIDTHSIYSVVVTPSPKALYLLSALLMVTCVRRSSSLRSMLGVYTLILALDNDFAWSHGSPIRQFVLFQFLVCSLVAHGLFFRDPLGRILGNLGVVLFCVGGVAVLAWFDTYCPQGTFWREGYLAALSVCMCFLWLLHRIGINLAAAWITAVEFMASVVLRVAELLLASFLRDGLLAFAAASVLLLSGFVLSLYKSGRLSRGSGMTHESN